MFAGNGRDTFNCRQDSEFLTIITHLQVFLLHVSGASIHDASCDLEVAEAKNLRLAQHIGGEFLDGIVCL